MKKMVVILTSVLLACLVLLSSSGLFLNKMVCLATGKTYVSLQPFDQCKPESSNQECVSSKCCDFSQVLVKLPIEALHKTDHKSPVPSDIHFPNTLISWNVSQLPEDIYAFSDLPPPAFSIKNTQAYLQAFLI